MSQSSSVSLKNGRLKWSCKYPSCKNSYFSNIINKQYKSKHFHRFPRNCSSLKNWKIACNISPSKNCSNYYVCEDHFSRKDYTLTCSFHLKPFAIPHSPDSSLVDQNFNDSNEIQKLYFEIPNNNSKLQLDSTSSTSVDIFDNEMIPISE